MFALINSNVDFIVPVVQSIVHENMNAIFGECLGMPLRKKKHLFKYTRSLLQTY